MSRKIAYIGFGALGRQLFVLLRQTSTDKVEEVFFDDIAAGEKLPGAYPFHTFMEPQFESHEFYLCLGYKLPGKKREVAQELLAGKRKLATFVHPSTILNPASTISPGCIIYAGCNIDQQVYLEEGVFLNNSVTLSHDTTIGKYSFLSPGVVTSGNVRVGAQCFIGAGSVISNGVSIGDDVIIGAGSVITKNIPAGASVIGNPMRILDTKLKLT